MSSWEEPLNTSDIHSEPVILGRNLGRLAPKFLEAKTWEHLLDTDMGRAQYGRFVSLMVERIRAEESNPDEIRNFVRLIATEHNGEFMRIAVQQIPELKHPRPYDSKHFQLTLLWYQLKRMITERNDKLSDWQPPHNYKDGLSKEEIGLIEKTMFGQTEIPLESHKLKRLFTSMMGMGFPQAAVRQSMHTSQALGLDILRDHQGLPSNLRLPVVRKDIAPFAPNYQSTLPLSLKTTAKSPLKAPERIASSATIDKNPLSDNSPPAELLRDPPFDEVRDESKGKGAKRGWKRSQQHSQTKKEVRTNFTEQLEEDKSIGENQVSSDNASPLPMTREEVLEVQRRKKIAERTKEKRGL